MRRIYILPFLLFQLNIVIAQSFYFEDGDTLTIISKSGANLRDSNSISSAKIISIPFGDKVIARNTKCCLYFIQDTFENRYGSWIYVEYKGKKGYLFSGFATKLKIPDINYKSIDCYNTGLFERIIRENADSLICHGTRIQKGFDQDGKDWLSSNWEFFNTETKITQVYGYEWGELILESPIINMNDVLNLSEYFLEKLGDQCNNHWFWNQEYLHGIKLVKEGGRISKIYCGGLGITAEPSAYKTIIRKYRD